LVVIAFRPRYTRKARKQGGTVLKTEQAVILHRAMDFAMAGWLHTGYGLTFARDMLPSYDDDIAGPYGRQSHHQFRNNIVVHDTLDQQLWEEEWLE
jgi:hypothetical protein